MKSALKTWLFAACAIAGFGCTSDPKTQVLTGRLSTRDAIAVRAVDGDTIVTAARVRSDGSFTLQLPAGHRYRLEVLTPSGVHNIVSTRNGSFTDLAFSVCQPTDPYDMGGCGDPGQCDPSDPNCKPLPCDPMTDPSCEPPPPPCDPSTDPNCKPLPCDLMTDPGCEPPPPCDPTDPNCMPPPCDPTDPNCMPPPCDPTTDPTCGTTCDPNDPMCVPPPPPPGCDPAIDPDCKCDPMTDPNCSLPPPCDPTDPSCGSGGGGGTSCQPGDPDCPVCDPMIDAMCPTPPPPCTDPMDPNTCKDPCMDDPALCGCTPDGTMNGDTTCWPPPEPCTMESCPDPWAPENPPGDFGCEGGGDGTN